MTRPSSGVFRWMKPGPLLGLAFALAASRLDAENTRPTPPAPPAPQASSGACASCHAEEAREWDASNHHRSASNASYLAALAREPLPFCRGCHAPSANPAYATPPASVAAGIACTDCHVGLPARHDRTNAPAARACASCHQFRFPHGDGLMQMTEAEHAKSAYADRECATCHMLPTNGHRSHRFDVVAMLPHAIVADVARASPTRLAFRLTPGEIGHAFPTGDLFRRASVRVESTDRRIVSERFLSRHFRASTLPDGTHPKVDDRDDRVGAGLGPCFELEAPATDARVEIALERVEQPRSSHDKDAEVSARFVVWQRDLPVSREGFRPCR